MSDFLAQLTAALEAHKPSRIRQSGAREAAVLIPIVAVPAPTIIFTRRTDSVGSHKGQISFPGGSQDEGDGSMKVTALRETEEEIGLDPSQVQILGELDTFPTFVSGYVVTPYVGWLSREPLLTPNPAEVAELLHVPITDLTNEIRADAGFVHADRTYPTEAWVWNDNVIWGVTARILRQFLDILGEAGLADVPDGTFDWAIPPAGHPSREP
jgi:8-oxo-dGTP pyrophosphatase MutT (NUDIX family)